MLPIFPDFKKLELSDKDDVEQITLQHPLYSDFNFVSMWSWDVNNEIEISGLHGNLVVRFSDYLDGSPLYSFLGKNGITKTAEELLEFAKSKTGVALLKNISEDIAMQLDSTLFVIEEDRDHFDYIYSLEEISELRGNKFASKRGFVNRFLRNYPKHDTRKIDLQDPAIQADILKLNEVWEQNKFASGQDPKSENELLALQRLFNSVSYFNIVALGLFIDEQMVGFTIDECVGGSQDVISHFIKGDVGIEGIYAVLTQNSSAYFYAAGQKFLNYEQDLGLPGLRKFKESWRPVSYLKKYVVRPRY